MVVKKVNLIQAVFAGGLFLLPFIFWPLAKIPYEIPRVWFFQRWVELLALLGIREALKESNELAKRGGNRKLVFGVIFFLIIALVASLAGMDFTKSLFGNYYRSDGLMTLLHLAGLFFFLVLFWKRSWEKATTAALALGSLWLSFWTLVLGIKYWFWGNWGDWGKWGGMVFGKAIGGTFGQPNFLAGYLLVTLPFTIFWIKKIWRKRGIRVIGILGLMGQMGAIGLTGSKAGIFGILLFIIGWFWLEGKLKKLGKLVVLAILGALILAGSLETAKELGFRKRVFLPEGRERIFRKSISSFRQKPIFGWGWANFDYAFEAVEWPIKFNQDVYVDKAHSGLLEVLVTTGVVGFAVYLYLIFWVLKFLWKEKSYTGEWGKTIFLVFALFLFHSQTNVISIGEEILFWLILGIVGNNSELVVN